MDLFNRIVEFLMPYMGLSEREGWLLGAFNDCEVEKQIGKRDSSDREFTVHLVKTLRNFGVCKQHDDPALCVLIRYIGAKKGVDVAAKADALCEEIGYIDPNKDFGIPPLHRALSTYCLKLIDQLEKSHWGMKHYIQEKVKFLPIYVSPYSDGVQKSESQELLSLLRGKKRMILLGEPGMGKTVALERFAWELASDGVESIPVIINLREYDGLPLLEWVRLKLLESNEAALRDALKNDADTERFLHEMPFKFYFLLDGLNEVSPKYRETILQQIRHMALKFPDDPIVVTSRVQDESWRELQGGSFQQIFIVQKITQTQAQDYLIAHLEHAEAEQLWHKLDARMKELIETPLLLWMVKEAWLETRGRVPGNRGELYANFIERMLRRDDDRKLNLKVSREARLAALERLALVMQKAGAVTIDLSQVRNVILDEQVLEALLVNGLLQGDKVIRFAPHQTVQEHFAARAIQADVEAELNKPPKRWYQKLFGQPEQSIFDYATDPTWTETFIQFAGLTNNPNQLARKIAETNPWLAWWCVREGKQVDRETERVIQAQSALLVDSENVQDRWNAVQALSQLPSERVIDQLAKLAVDTDESVYTPARRKLDELGEAGKKAVAKGFEQRIVRYEPLDQTKLILWLAKWGKTDSGYIGDIEIVVKASCQRWIDSALVQDRRNAVKTLSQLPLERVIDQLAKLAVDTDESVYTPARRKLDELGEAGKKAVAKVFEQRIVRYEPPVRAELGRWLSQWGDMRRGVGVRSDGLPDIDWVTIPAGEFIYGDKSENNGPQKMTLPTFQISRYPVTYAQFQAFLDDDYDRWFDGLAAHNYDRRMADQYFQYANHPREMVNWYQAMAFCRWFSARLGGEADLDKVAEWAVRLPTEFEWEKAARGTHGLIYPWGNEYKEGYANINETLGNIGHNNLGQTSAVGMYSQGASPYGVQDMSGNVWEWCLTDYRNPAPLAEHENVRSNALRVLRGGSWSNGDRSARAASRDGLDPLYRGYGSLNFGFRVVCVRAPSL